ncbi:SMP-30/gluconolactonase/LRE family protein [Hoeflea sp.]|uniref:SMP-30/gluconolactonase/LRE family protein n=1 Tax=Hoeflea sp. TaxID=1940281 RepID=UPI003B0162FD
MTLSGFECSLFDDTNLQLGEGPTYDPETDTAWWFDISGSRLLELKLGDKHTRVHELPFMASALAVIDEDRQLLATEHGLFTRSIRDGSFELHTAIESDNPSTRSNDSRVHPCGAFWIGTMSKSTEANAGSIYHFFRGELRRLYTDITVPNATCFSADGSVGYFTDTPTGVVMRVSLDPATGLPEGQPQPFIVREDSDPGWADGAVMDADGLLWIARWEGSCVQAFDSSGTVAETIELPALQVTCPAFVGTDASQMIVTTAAGGLDEQEMSRQPLNGNTFLLNRHVNGRLEPKVLL